MLDRESLAVNPQSRTNSVRKNPGYQQRSDGAGSICEAKSTLSTVTPLLEIPGQVPNAAHPGRGT
jgi:hypothetical protein